jgi:hypothetical protein
MIKQLETFLVESTWQHRLFGLLNHAFLDHPDKPGGVGDEEL